MSVRKGTSSSNFDKDGKKSPYRAPMLLVYGKVALLTQSAAGSCFNDGNGCAPVPGGTRMNSERRLKENVVRIGTHPLGVGLYLFDYKNEYREMWGQGRQFGVIAEEVERTMPEAVSVTLDGYKLVDYGLLGISLACH
jgi:hypothetical protein